MNTKTRGFMFKHSKTYNDSELMYSFLMLFQMINSCRQYGEAVENETGKHILYMAGYYNNARQNALNDLNEIKEQYKSEITGNQVAMLSLIEIYLDNHAILKACNLLKGFGLHVEGDNPEFCYYVHDTLFDIDDQMFNDVNDYGCTPDGRELLK